MKRMIIAGVSALCLLTACGVDKEGTADKLIEVLEDSSGAPFSDGQKECVKDVVKGYSDDELEDLSKDEAAPDITDRFQTEVVACLTDLAPASSTPTD
jgi:hypothetical protein